MAWMLWDGCDTWLLFVLQTLPHLFMLVLGAHETVSGPGQSFPVAERIARRGFYIPSGAHPVIAMAIAPAKVLLNHNASGQALP